MSVLVLLETTQNALRRRGSILFAGLVLDEIETSWSRKREPGFQTRLRNAEKRLQPDIAWGRGVRVAPKAAAQVHARTKAMISK